MQCHGTPKDAPAALVAMYGDRAGFYEKIGDIRAFISVTMPLEVELSKMRKLYMIFAGLLTIIFALLIFIIFYFRGALI
ncbi:MAG: DUF3365 domain-containing protein [Epsilonproteobacteria bacterium]|nr:DUF3365 domain-containing protein [Campylobacterota bacterium]